MSNLVVSSINTQSLTEEDGQLWMTSRQLAEVFGKTHKHVLRDIEQHSPELGSLIKSSTYSVPGQTRQYPQYLLSRKGVLAISAFYDIAVGVALVEKIEELEKSLVSMAPVAPALMTRTEALRIALEESERADKAEEALKEQTDLISLKTLAKTEGIGYEKLKAVIDLVHGHEEFEASEIREEAFTPSFRKAGCKPTNKTVQWGISPNGRKRLKKWVPALSEFDKMTLADINKYKLTPF